MNKKALFLGTLVLVSLSSCKLNVDFDPGDSFKIPSLTGSQDVAGDEKDGTEGKDVAGDEKDSAGDADTPDTTADDIPAE